MNPAQTATAERDDVDDTAKQQLLHDNALALYGQRLLG